MNEQDVDVMGRMFTKELFRRGQDPKWWAWFSSGAVGSEPSVPGPFSESFPDGPFSASDAPGLRCFESPDRAYRCLMLENVFPGKCAVCGHTVRVSEGVCQSKKLVTELPQWNGFFLVCNPCIKKGPPVSRTWVAS